MLKNDRTELSYAELVRKARQQAPGRRQKFKVALLADVSTQHLAPLLRVLFASNGVDVEIYEAGYDTVELEAFDPASGLYAFEPHLVCIFQSLWKLKSLYYVFVGDRTKFSEVQAAKTEAVWKAIQSRTQAQVMQSTFVLPYERPFGNYGSRVEDTLMGAVTELNRTLSLKARALSSVFMSDIDYLAAWVGRRHFLDEKLWALSKSLCALEFLPDVAQNVVDIALATYGRGVKCVVLDLDNTIWGGVVGDDGFDGIGLGDLDDGDAFRFFQSYLLELSRRGVVLAVCSKNDEAIARRVFKEHPGMVLREEHIAVFVANWLDKATNIRHIREELNIGYDTMVFLDDNPFERNLVRQLIPEIIVPELPEDPALYVRTISELNLFETASHSSLDGQRNVLYEDQEKRDIDKSRFASLDDYLASLETTAVFSRFEPRNLSRIAQLIQRSNQFNLTTRRYSEAECVELMNDAHHFYPFSITVHDRFGKFGLINVVVLRKTPEALEIDTFLMSCRVLQRGIEQYAMNKIFDYARLCGYKRVNGRYIPTAKNMMVAGFFEKFGFDRADADEGDAGTTWHLTVADYEPREVPIRELKLPQGADHGESTQ
ncbi:MAG: HAD-IIIC family phosphatase [Burkholderiales bacterium]|nr:HAD-IIIC family phosphatase [Burkholderiales bacterium]